ncbi:MAG TPA: MBL fold metallo-hydrolase [Firmicutes bacterium]|jgi:glyoxylase-like metal-dependent hydrolase (beta-lactamase superfamily II)|nr:MBL fold metallo-hydrolase [Bacillota bacterium]
MWSKILKCPEASIYRIELPGPLPGYRQFITPWLITQTRGSKPLNILIDPGPGSSIPQLAGKLKELGIHSLDWVFLTHIHIDHAGGVGLLSKSYPSAKVLVHPRGKRHLAHPEKLWQGSLGTLGTLARLYGEITPAPEDNLVDAAEITCPIHGISVLDTPGHAPHHLSYLLTLGEQRILFAGEGAGVFMPKAGETPLYMRPATPPRFFFNTSVNTLDLLGSTEPTLVCCGHYGVSRQAKETLSLHKEQLHLWREVIGKYRGSGIDTILGYLLNTDHLLRPFAEFDEEVRQREKHFLANSIKGFLESFSQEA